MAELHWRRRDVVGGLFGLTMAGLAGRASAQTSMSAFRDEVLAVGAARFPDLPPSPGRDDREVVSGNLHFDLQNLFGLSSALPRDAREAEIVKWFNEFRKDVAEKDKAIDAASDVWSGAKPLLRPQLVPSLYATYSKTLVHRPFGGDLILAFSIDHGNKDAYVLEPKWAEWGVTLAEVEAAAIADLGAMSTKVALDSRPSENGTGRFLTVTLMTPCGSCCRRSERE